MLAHFAISNVDPSQRAYLRANAPPGICVVDASDGMQLDVEFEAPEIAMVADCLASTILHVRVNSKLSSDGEQIPFDAEKIAAHLERLVGEAKISKAG